MMARLNLALPRPGQAKNDIPGAPDRNRWPLQGVRSVADSSLPLANTKIAAIIERRSKLESPKPQ